MAGANPREIVKLSEPQNSSVTLEKTLLTRRSVRSYDNKSIARAHIAQLLWSAQGVTSPKGFRTSPSAGALYPLEIFVAAGFVVELDPGVFKYDPHEHLMTKTRNGDARAGLCRAAYGQRCVLHAPICFAICAVYERVTRKYGERGIRYTHMEAGHAAQNICLQATALGLGTVVVGSFSDDGVKTIINAAPDEVPLYLIPTGFPEKT
jgi:SagB-type dehydrogenase family enzyme